MSTYTMVVYQVVFGSKNYTSFLTRRNQDLLFKYIAGILINKKCHPYMIGGHNNHLHIVFGLHSSLALSDLVRDIKKSTTEMIKDHKNYYQNFPGWQVGYGAFTYSSDSLDRLVDYVRDQAIHHRRKTFREELIEFCNDHGVPYDEKYLLT